MKVLVIDIGGSNVKFRITGHDGKWKEPSGAQFSPSDFLKLAQPLVAETNPDVITVGFPAEVRDGRIIADPSNIGAGWINYDFEAVLGKPTKVINDAALQALGAYNDCGRMLFLGLGTGLGSAIIDCGRIVPLELCRLRYSKNKTLEDAISKATLKLIGQSKWQKAVWEVVNLLKDSLLAQNVVIGGGCAKFLEQVPDWASIGGNKDAFRGGIRLWEDSSIEIGGGGRS